MDMFEGYQNEVGNANRPPTPTEWQNASPLTTDALLTDTPVSATNDGSTFSDEELASQVLTNMAKRKHGKICYMAANLQHYFEQLGFLSAESADPSADLFHRYINMDQTETVDPKDLVGYPHMEDDSNPKTEEEKPEVNGAVVGKNLEARSPLTYRTNAEAAPGGPNLNEGPSSTNTQDEPKPEGDGNRYSSSEDDSSDDDIPLNKSSKRPAAKEPQQRAGKKPANASTGGKTPVQQGNPRTVGKKTLPVPTRRNVLHVEPGDIRAEMAKFLCSDVTMHDLTDEAGPLATLTSGMHIEDDSSHSQPVTEVVDKVESY
jgi:hypothetical protein